MKPLVSIVFLLISLQMLAQDRPTYPFANVEVKPEFPGGIKAFNSYIADNFEIPEDIDFKGGKMIISFVIDTTGAITDVNVPRDIGFGTAAQAKRLFPSAQNFLPGMQDGKKVNVSYVMPLTVPAPEPVYKGELIETKPEYPGGPNAFYHCVGRNFVMPMEEVQGKIFISFVIEKDGSVGSVKVIRDIGFGTGSEAVRVVKLCGNWTPGLINGEPVRVLYSLPINVQGPTR